MVNKSKIAYNLIIVMIVKQQLVDKLKSSCSQLLKGVADDDLASSIEFTDSKFGDFAINIAFRLSKKLKKSPKEIAKSIAIKLKKTDIVEKCEVAGAGFVNIRLKSSVWTDYISKLDHGFLDSKAHSGKTTQIEFISANPTGPLVLVNAWAGFFGDVLGNILFSQGYKVTREYYFNDGGNQIVNLGKTIQAKFGKEFSSEEKDDFYKGNYIDELAKKISLNLGGSDKIVNSNPYEVGREATEILFASHIKPNLDQLKIKFDSFFPESSLDNKKTIDKLRKLNAIKEYDGAIWLDGQKVGLDEDQVLVRSYDHGETYFLKDISYQLDKLEKRKIDQAIVILGPDHHGQVKRLEKTMKYLGYDNLHLLWTQTIRLVKDKKEFKMSKRAGNIILLEDFLTEIPSDVARFFFLKRDINSHMDFDLDLAKEQSKRNPIYYVMYSYVRAKSILAQAKKVKITSDNQISHKLNKKELEMIKNISKSSDIVVKITSNYKVHTLLVNFIELAKSFHDYYESERILKLQDTQAKSKLALVNKYVIVCEDLFRLIGVTPVEKM